VARGQKNKNRRETVWETMNRHSASNVNGIKTLTQQYAAARGRLTLISSEREKPATVSIEAEIANSMKRNEAEGGRVAAPLGKGNQSFAAIISSSSRML